MTLGLIAEQSPIEPCQSTGVFYCSEREKRRVSKAMPMRQDTQTRGRFRVDVLDTVDRIGATTDLGSLYELLGRTFSAFAFDHFVISGIPLPSEALETAILLRNWPKGWFEMYVRRGFVKCDPTVRMCHATTMPFEWSEAPAEDHLIGGATVMNFARDFGLLKGFSLPIHGLEGRTDCVSLGGRSPELNAHTKPALHLLSMYAFEQARRLALLRSEKSGRHSRRNPLTPREREVLTWAAVGKSHADIAEILTIAERTVTAHMVNAAVKLGAANRTHAVVKAMQSRLIRV